LIFPARNALHPNRNPAQYWDTYFFSATLITDSPTGAWKQHEIRQYLQAIALGFSVFFVDKKALSP
jgi:hypothetical protein